jgi:hypothetical protein
MTSRIAVESSNIAAVGYDPQAKILYVEFLNGGVYAYAEVELDAYTALMAAESKGKYLNREIKPSHPVGKMDGWPVFRGYSQKALDELFDLATAGMEDWRAAIDTTWHPDAAQSVADAIAFRIGEDPTQTTLASGLIRIESKGYRAGPAGP